ncbi:glycosyltransferase family 4 protein [Hydrogenovibrio sp. JE_KL2]|uniref:glycosyltransferase family 4 protein n=1 Tax=Hydrogenovibrio sp. JE_KL2 TaxID=2651188 RepID=UPI00128D4671|nr:glycosyltransferase family 4 protein [Hydrogenovibrio sp. JE_KL2]MPQ75470.1 glycosyltransferase family 4 protein [Hydrogenovibrio sp. JE_KL2]
MKQSVTVLFVVNCPKFFVSHRLPVAKAMLDAGCEIHVASSGGSLPVFQELGIHFHQINFSRKGGDPLSELKVVWKLLSVFKALQPDLVHLVTIKPYLYGGIAAKLAKVPSVVSAVSGLGAVFISSRAKARLLRLFLWPLFKLAFSHKNQSIIFQNEDDARLLEAWGVVSPGKIKFIRGSGVDLKDYSYITEPEGKIVVTFAARLLLDKGIREFVEASKLIYEKGIEAEFWVVGKVDHGNPASIKQLEVNSWRGLPNIKVLGFRKDIVQLYQQSNIICLPSYREGLPKSLIEAAACGRAVVTTDVPGCRDAIIPGLTGVLVPVNDAKALDNAISDLIQHPEKRKMMGYAGRKFAEREFTIEKVVAAHIAIYDELLKARK